MKKLIASLLLTVLVGGSALLPASQMPSAYSRAFELFVPVACQATPDADIRSLGTGFPVGDGHWVMTAQHVDCQAVFGEDAKTLISTDKGKSWIEVPLTDMFLSNDYDFQLFRLSFQFKHPARFRTAKLGESVVNFSIMGGTLFTHGNVEGLQGDWVIASNEVAGGVSGSALVAEDGMVVGIATNAMPAITGTDEGPWPTTWFTKAISAKVLKVQCEQLWRVLKAPHKPLPKS